MASFRKKYGEYVEGKLYEESGGNSGEAERIFNSKDFYEDGCKVTITSQTILKWWKEKELEINAQGGHRHGIPERIFRKVHSKSESEVNKIERYLRKKFGYDKEYIKVICRKLGLPYH